VLKLRCQSPSELRTPRARQNLSGRSCVSKSKRVAVVCQNPDCQKEFSITPSMKARGKGKFCSTGCRYYKTVAERFWKKVNKDGPIHPELGTPCWLWMACCDKNGYGQFGIRGKTYLAHRVSYEILQRSIPEGLTLDHLCRVRHCVNPNHLEPVIKLVNTMRGVSFGALNKQKTACKRGHPYNSTNTRISSKGYRDCRKCNAIAVKAYKARKKSVAS
jgi:hypothetical protein